VVSGGSAVDTRAEGLFVERLAETYRGCARIHVGKREAEQADATKGSAAGSADTTTGGRWYAKRVAPEVARRIP